MLLDGEVTLAELSDDHQIEMEVEDVVTIAGLALARTGTLPQEGEQLEVDGYRLTIEGTICFKITRVRLDRADHSREGV